MSTKVEDSRCPLRKVSMVSDSPEPRNSSSQSSNLAPLATLGELGLAVLALVIGWSLDFAPGASLAPDRFHAAARVFAIGLGLAACLPPLGFLWYVSRTDWRPMADLRTLVEEQVMPWFATSHTLEFAGLSIAAGLSEELLFRGLLQDGLAQWWGGPWAVWWGLGISSVIFGLGHALSRTYLFLATGMSVYLGLLYIWTGDLLTPMITHAGYDFVALVWLRRTK